MCPTYADTSSQGVHHLRWHWVVRAAEATCPNAALLQQVRPSCRALPQSITACTALCCWHALFIDFQCFLLRNTTRKEMEHVLLVPKDFYKTDLLQASSPHHVGRSTQAPQISKVHRNRFSAQVRFGLKMFSSLYLSGGINTAWRKSTISPTAYRRKSLMSLSF